MAAQRMMSDRTSSIERELASAPSAAAGLATWMTARPRHVSVASTRRGPLPVVSSGGSRLSQRRLELLLHVPHHYLDSNLFNEVLELLVQLLRIVGSTCHLFEPGASPK